MRAGRVFFDSNVLLYAHDTSDMAKLSAAGNWLSEISLHQLAMTNLQVLNEVSSVLFRKRKELSSEQVFSIVDDFAALGAAPLTWIDVLTARAIRATSGYSWWDCLLLASARELGCSHFLSEDLQDGQQIGGLTIINPFIHAPETILGPLED